MGLETFYLPVANLSYEILKTFMNKINVIVFWFNKFTDCDLTKTKF